MIEIRHEEPASWPAQGEAGKPVCDGVREDAQPEARGAPEDGGDTDARALRDEYALRAAFRDRLGISVSDRGDARWTARQLAEVYRAFSLLDAHERESLRGLVLVRAHLPPAGDNGDAAGLYEPHTATWNARRVRPASITLYDLAFEDPEGDFASEASASNPSLLYEAGHAIAEQALAEAIVADNAALDRQRAASDALNLSLPELRMANAEAELAARDFNQEVGALRFTKKQLRQLNAFARASREVSTAATHANNARSRIQLERALRELGRALEDRETALAAMPEVHPARIAVLRFSRAIDRALEVARSGAELRGRYFEACEARLPKRRAVSALTDRGRSVRLASFARMLKRSGDRPVTAYGTMGTPESFAEALMLYRNDPHYLRLNRPAMYRWFEQREHTR